MTIIVPDHYHARKRLEENRITCIRQEQALRQDIRPLRIAFLPTEPQSLVEQVSLLRPLGMSIVQALPILLQGLGDLSEDERAPEEVLQPGVLDGLVIVGSALAEPDLVFRERLSPLLQGLRNDCPVLGLGYGALWLTELCGIPYRSLAIPKIGVWEVDNLRNDHPVVGESDDEFFCPQLRTFEPERELFAQAVEQQQLQVLCACAGEPLIWDTMDHKWLMHLGNPEYNVAQLLRSLSWQKSFEGPELFDPDRPVNVWKSHRNDLFTHWLKHCYNFMNSVVE